MKRRSFLAALAGLPLVGRLFAAETPTVEPAGGDTVSKRKSADWHGTSESPDTAGGAP